jgi:hypothetical protein
MKKGDVAEFSAKWWRTSQPKDLSSAGKLDKALKAYESSQSKLKSAASPEAQKEALEALDDVETAVRSVIAEAKRVKGNPELALTADILGKMDFAAERKAAETAVKKGADEDEDENEGGLSDPDTFKLALRKGLHKLENGRLNFGFVAGKKAIHHRLVLSRTKGPQGLAAAAARELRLTAFTFGVARSSEERPDTILLYLGGKQLPGLAKKGTRMLKAFKPQPFGQIALFVDGNEVQDILDEADEDTDDAAPESDADTAPTAGQLRAAMERLTPALRQAMAASPNGRETLMSLTKQFVTLLNNNKIADAARILQQLTESLGQASSGAAPNGAVAFGKLRLEWDTTKKSVAGDIARLKSNAAQAFDGDSLLDALDTLDEVIARFNEGLGDRLDDIDNAADSGARKQAAQAATSIADSYLTYVDSDPLIGLIEINPLAPITVAAPLETTLTKIRDALATLTA